MKTLIIALSLCLPALVCLAQAVSPDTIRPLPANRKPVAVLKLAPLTLFELQNTLEIGAEVRMHDRMSVQGQFGYAPDWLIWQSSLTQYTNRENWRGRFEARWYIGHSRRMAQPGPPSFPLGRYIAIDLLYKQLNTINQQTIGHQCAAGNCAYFEKGSSLLTRYIGGLGIKIGGQSVIGHRRATGAPSWLLDAYLGVGVRKGWTQEPAVEPDAIRFYRGSGFLTFDPFRAPNQFSPNALLGIKVGYVL
jgi:hypothetical protein